MLLETKRGKENKVVIPDSCAYATGNHTWTRDGGYQPAAYTHQEYPKSLYRKRAASDPAVVLLLNDLFGVVGKEDRQNIYLQAMQVVGEAGVDIRQWPMTAPSDPMLKAMQSVLRIQARDQIRDQWLADNPTKTAADYKQYVSAPDEAIVNSAAEEEEKLAAGWSKSILCK